MSVSKKNFRERLNRATEEYKQELNNLEKNIRKVRNTTTSLGISGVGKTAEIIRALEGDGTIVDTKSTSKEDLISVKTYTCNVIIPLPGFTKYHVLVKSKSNYKFLGKSVSKDPAGQYDTLIEEDYFKKTEEGNMVTSTKGNMARYFNINLLSNNAVLEAVIDSTRPKTINPLIDKWMNKMLFEEATGNEGAVASFYFSKAALKKAKIDFNAVKMAQYESLHEACPRLDELIKKFKSKGHKIMGFAGDIDVGEEHKSKIYLIYTGGDGWLKKPIETRTEKAMQLTGPKALPLIKYWKDNGYLTNAMTSIIKLVEEHYLKTRKAKIITF